MAHSDKLSAVCLRLVRDPVSEQNYAGEDVRFSGDFEYLEGQLNSAQSILGAGHIDWIAVRETAERILREQSRDLRVACWWTWALYRCESFPGLVAGISVLKYLCEQYWQAIYPFKLRTRSAAFAWLISRLEKVLVEDVSIKSQLPLFRHLSESLDQLDELLGRYLGEEAPLLLPLRRRLSRMLRSASHDESKPAAIVAQVKEVASQLFSHSSIGNDKEARRAVDTHQELAQSLCAWWLKQKATDCRALRLNRSVMWLSIESTPECNAERITPLRGVPSDRIASYRERFGQGKYADLIVDIESSVARSPFWFDGQRMVWECLQALQAESAMREVEAHFALFLQRVPGVVDLRFHDGQPFADSATHCWIKTQVMPHVLSASSECIAPDASVRPEWEVVVDEVAQTLPRHGLKSAVQVLTQHMQNSKGGRERFFWQLGLARICYQARKYELARIQLDALDAQLQKGDLYIWEPDVFLEISRLLYSCHELLPQSQDSSGRKDELYRRLCHYDLEMVLDNA